MENKFLSKVRVSVSGHWEYYHENLIVCGAYGFFLHACVLVERESPRSRNFFEYLLSLEQYVFNVDSPNRSYKTYCFNINYGVSNPFLLNVSLYCDFSVAKCVCTIFFG